MNSWALARRAASSTSRVAGIGTPKADVVGDGPRKEEGVLGHEAHLLPQGALGDLAHVEAVDLYRALGHVVEAGNQVGDGGLARAGRPHQGDGLSRRDVEVHVVQDAGVAAVGESRRRAARPCHSMAGISAASGGVAHLGLGVEQGQHALAARHGRLHGGVERLSSWIGWKKRVT